MASSLAFQPDRWLDCSLSFALLPDSYFSCQAALLCQPTCTTCFIGSTIHNESSSSCVCSPTSVSTVLHLHTCRGTVSHCLPTPVGLNCILQKFISCLFRESAQTWWVLVDSTMLLRHRRMTYHLCSVTLIWYWLANVNSRSRSLYAIARPSVVCL